VADEIRFWQVNDDNLLAIQPSRLDLEQRIERWILRDISVLDPNLLVIGQQVETAYGKLIDLLCIDSDGGVVIVELKRDKTPRDVTAQALDYASWVQTLNAEAIQKIAAEHLNGDSLELAFRQKFAKDFPDALNENHSIVVVASEIDDGTERIIRYLSDAGIRINAARFSFYKSTDGREFLSRTFTVALEEAERTASKGKRIVTTPVEMERRADGAGVGDLYREALNVFGPCFDNHGTNKTALWFSGAIEEGSTSRKIILSLVPGSSSKENGLRYQIYRDRLASYANTTADNIFKHLPSNPEEYANYAAAPDDLRGWSGYIRNLEDVKGIASLFERAVSASA
jgi:hypothetical protein